MRRTRIVCTIGPATASPRMLEALVRAGMDVARLNFSHGDHPGHAAVIAALRAVAAEAKRPVAILQDLCGPKIRLGVLARGPMALRRGQVLTLTADPAPVGADAVPLPVPEMLAALQPGDHLLADDGLVSLRVVARSGDDVTVRAVTPGVLSTHKGVTVPGLTLSLPAVTDRDIEDLRFGLAHGVDWVAASYVRSAADLAPLRRVMAEVGVRRPLMAKIEKMEAVRCIDDIVEAADGVMVARGDLGVEVPIDEVPVIQKRIIRLCNAAARPVVTATQMLDSMIRSPRPTRAEVTDVANAILDGTDAVMLSGETAVGEYPLEAVRMMARIARRAETQLPDVAPQPACAADDAGVAATVARATVDMAASLRAAAIVCATTSGSTARLISRYRPRTPIVGVTPRPETYRQLAMVWGVQCVLIDHVQDTDEMMQKTIAAAVAAGHVRPGDRVIVTAGVPISAAGATNLIRVHVVGEPLAAARPADA